MTASFLNLDVPLVGLPIELIRTYDGRERVSPYFGHGWTLPVRNVRVVLPLRVACGFSRHDVGDHNMFAKRYPGS